jgi:hypothetical protein
VTHRGEQANDDHVVTQRKAMTPDGDRKDEGDSATSNQRAEHLSTPPKPFENIA